jgi:ABC-type nitrate/sulfonate/bicarbonate transport system permease component
MMTDRLKKIVSVCVACAAYAAVIIAIWYSLIYIFHVPPFIIPHPEDVALSLYRDSVYYKSQFYVTTVEAMLGAGIGFLSGLAVGVFLRFGGAAARLLHPPLVASQVFPKEALAPIFLLVFGFGVESKIAISALISFFPVAITIHRGLLETPASYLNFLTSVGATGWSRFWLVHLPCAAPYVFSSLRICATLSVIGSVVGEFVGSSGGLGYVIRIATGEQATERVYAALLLLGLLGGALYIFVSVLESVCFRRYTKQGVRL